jgi:hypothetical protein
MELQVETQYFGLQNYAALCNDLGKLYVIFVSDKMNPSVPAVARTVLSAVALLEAHLRTLHS